MDANGRAALEAARPSFVVSSIRVPRAAGLVCAGPPGFISALVDGAKWTWSKEEE